MAKTKWITCAAHSLTLKRGDAFVVELDVQDEDENAYQFRVRLSTDRKALTKKILQLIADRWPKFDWEFQADDAGEITDVR